MQNKILEAFMSGVSQKRQTEQQAKDEEFRQKQFKLAQDEFKANHDELLRQHDIENARSDSIAAFNKSVAELKQQEEIQAHYSQYGVVPPGSTVEKPKFQTPPTNPGDFGAAEGITPMEIPADLSGILKDHARITDPKGRTLDALTPEGNAQLQAKVLDITQGPLIERQFKKEQQIQAGQANIERMKIESERLKEENAHSSRMAEIALQNAGRISAAKSRGVSDSSTSKILGVKSKFDSNDIVKKHVILRDTLREVEAIPDVGATGSDDMALVYASAKTSDPISAVRDSERESVAKNAQTIAKKFGVAVDRINDSSAFLSPEARKEIKAALKRKVDTSQPGFDLLKSETERIIKKIDPTGEGWLAEYDMAKPEPKPESKPGSSNNLFFDEKGNLVNPPETKEETLPDVSEVPSSTTKETVAQRHLNPLNLKLGGATKRLVDLGIASIGEKSTDGGNFLKFKTENEGFQAALALLSSDVYANLTVDEAMKKWSNSGYSGKDIAPNIASTKKIKDLDILQKAELVKSMAHREGYN